jgi:hypothetical protein
MANVEDFRLELQRQLRQAQVNGLPWVEIQSRDLHRAVGGYPNNGQHSMPTCCDVMYEEQHLSDSIVSKPPSGKGASLVIRYKLPR